MNEENDIIKISVSATQKVNLGNYESADVFVALSNLDSGVSEDEMMMALETGELAFGCVKAFIRDRVAEIRRNAG